MKQKRGYKVSILTISALMLISMSGCSSTNDDDKTTSNEEVLSSLQSKYAKEEKLDYTNIEFDVARNKAFTFPLSKEANEKFKTITDTWNDIIGVYRDSGLTQSVSYKADSDESSVTISPFRNPVFGIPDTERGGTLNDQGQWEDWGNSQQYFLVKYYDLQTGEKLTKPEVTIFDIKTEIRQTPKVEFYVTENGVAGLRWQEIKDASNYAILAITENKDGKGIGRTVEIIDTVKDTKWEDTNSDNNKINWNFRTAFGDSVDTVFNEQKQKLESGEITIDQFASMSFTGENEYELAKDKYFAVVALNDKGTSAISNLIDKRMVASQVPVGVAFYMNEGGIRPNGDDSTATIDRSVALTTSHTWIIMADGTVSQKLVNYNIDKVKEDVKQIVSVDTDENGNILYDENGKMVNYKSEDVPCLSIPYTIEGTSFKGYAQIMSYDQKNYKNELKELKQRQDSLRDKTGDIIRETKFDVEENEGEVAKALNTEYEVYASSALSEYLALQMLNGETRVNLDAFKEAYDQEYLVDAWQEAIYQNPLVLGVRGLSYDTKKNDIIISYDQSHSEQKEKQQEIINKVEEVTKSIIKDDMTPLQKEQAINDYLCSNAKYNDEALKNAEKNNFKFVDAEYNDSFTAYGILINNNGVCAGYAGAFKLLADKAGLTSIVTTGYLQGSLPHAWNRVQIDDQWYTIDVTNNDNEFFSNGLFNLSDQVAKDVLTEDTLYALDEKLPTYKADNDTNEYYKYNQKFFNQVEVIDKLVADIQTNKKAVYRTDYTLSEEQFYTIASSVIEKTGNKDLQGGYFLGVIYLSE